MREERIHLMQYRLESAREKLNSAKILLEAGAYKDSIGRSYYAIFTSVRALLALDGVDFSKHAGSISYFQKTYVKTNIIDKKYSKILSTAFQIRNNCDYTDFYLVSKKDASEQYHNAEVFLLMIETFIEKYMKEFESEDI